jgi:hypothetical protein
VRLEAPLRSRTLFPGYAWFIAVDHTVLISPRVCLELLACAAGARPDGTGGLLLGRVLHDADGPYTLVTAAVEVPPDSGPAPDPELVARLTEEAARRFPAADPLGWWRSRAGSDADERPDRDGGHHLAVVVCGEGDTGEWARVYVGPAGTRAWPLVAPAADYFRSA